MQYPCQSHQNVKGGSSLFRSTLITNGVLAERSRSNDILRESDFLISFEEGPIPQKHYKDMGREELKGLLLQSTEKCIEALSKIIDQHSPFYNNLILLSKQLEEGRKNISAGLVSYSDWSVTQRQIELGLLQIIDSIDALQIDFVEEKTLVKKNLQNGIEFFTNILIGQGYEYIEKIMDGEWHEKNTKFEATIVDAKCEHDGSFQISVQLKISKKDFFIDHNNFRQLRKSVEIRENHTFFGNLKEINRIQIGRHPNDLKCYEVICKTTNFKKSLLCRISRRNGQKLQLSPPLEIYTDTLILFAPNHETAKRIQNSIDYISIALGREEDTF